MLLYLEMTHIKIQLQAQMKQLPSSLVAGDWGAGGKSGEPSAVGLNSADSTRFHPGAMPHG